MQLIILLISFHQFHQKKKAKKSFLILVVLAQYQISQIDIKQPKIVACTDGVGTKIEIANTLNKYDTIGIDLSCNECK